MTAAAKQPARTRQREYTRRCIVCKVSKPITEYVKGYATCTRCHSARLHGTAGITPINGTGPGTTYDRYDAAELRPFTGRPGAMDAFALPSRHMGWRRWRDGREEAVTE